MDPIALTRKKKVRAGHRGTATRLIREASENLQAEEGPDLAKLRQQKLSLEQKVQVLSNLDSEILELTPTEELEEEIMQADIVKEKLGLAIIGIETALCPALTPSEVHFGVESVSEGGSSRASRNS